MFARSALVLVLCCPAAALAATLPVQPGLTYCGDGIDLSAEGVGGEDFYCEAVSQASPSGEINLLCEDAEGTPDDEPIRVTIVEDIATETVSYISPDGPVTLERCE
jgi:hypothetical protein